MQRYFDPTRLNFLFLVPLAEMALSDEDALNAEDLSKEFVGNTVVAQLPEGTAYAFAEPGGVARGLHPTEGRINSRYEISDDGVVCVTWPLSSGEIKNCDKTFPKGDHKVFLGRANNRGCTWRTEGARQLGMLGCDRCRSHLRKLTVDHQALGLSDQ